MAVCIIYKGNEQINRIVADEDFARSYCAEHGYTYIMEPEPPRPPEPEPEKLYTAQEMIAAMAASIREGVNQV